MKKILLENWCYHLGAPASNKNINEMMCVQKRIDLNIFHCCAISGVRILTICDIFRRYTLQLLHSLKWWFSAWRATTFEDHHTLVQNTYFSAWSRYDCLRYDCLIIVTSDYSRLTLFMILPSILCCMVHELFLLSVCFEAFYPVAWDVLAKCSMHIHVAVSITHVCSTYYIPFWMQTLQR